MAYVTLETAKRHLNVEIEFTDDDQYITGLIQVAEIAVANDIRTELKTLEGEKGEIPSPLFQCILLMVGNLYANRESLAFVQIHELPLSYRYLTDQYRNYAK